MRIIWFIVTLGVAALITTLIFLNTQQADINYYQGYRYFEKGQLLTEAEYNAAKEFLQKAKLYVSKELEEVHNGS